MFTGVGRAPATDQQRSLEESSRLGETVLAMIVARAPLPKILGALCTEIENRTLVSCARFFFLMLTV